MVSKDKVGYIHEILFASASNNTLFLCYTIQKSISIMRGLKQELDLVDNGGKSESKLDARRV